MRVGRLATIALLFVYPGTVLAAPCPLGGNCLGDPKAWAAALGDASPTTSNGLSIRRWQPDNSTSCIETRNGSLLKRTVIFVGANGSSLTENPSPAFWNAMGCNNQTSVAPATWDTMSSSIDRATAIEARRKASAAAKGIRLCDATEFRANPTDCMRRARLADAP